MNEPVITSRQNSALKRLRAVRAGKEDGFIVLEGIRLVRDALASGHELAELFVAEDKHEWLEELASLGDRVRTVEPELLGQISSLVTSPGVIAVCHEPRSRTLADLSISDQTLVLVICGISDPGNLGALARSAEALGASALVVVRGGASPWNEKALRGSMGSLLRLPVARVATADEVASELESLGVRQVAAATRGGKALTEFDWKGSIALWIGAETGDAPEVAHEFEGVTIPMAGSAESFNVTVAASLLLYAAGRVKS